MTDDLTPHLPPPPPIIRPELQKFVDQQLGFLQTRIRVKFPGIKDVVLVVAANGEGTGGKPVTAIMADGEVLLLPDLLMAATQQIRDTLQTLALQFADTDGKAN